MVVHKMEDQTNQSKVGQSVGYISYVDDAKEAVLGIPADITTGREPLYDVVTKKNRLRGIGFLLVFIAVILAVLGLVRSV